MQNLKIPRHQCDVHPEEVDETSSNIGNGHSSATEEVTEQDYIGSERQSKRGAFNFICKILKDMYSGNKCGVQVQEARENLSSAEKDQPYTVTRSEVSD